MTYFELVVEDVIQERVVRKIVSGRRDLAVNRVLLGRGAAAIDANLHRYAQASVHIPYLVVRDLDTALCAPELSRRLLPATVPSRLLLVIPVREVEAWLIADRQALRALPRPTVPQSGSARVDPRPKTVHRAGSRTFAAAVRASGSRPAGHCTRWGVVQRADARVRA